MRSGREKFGQPGSVSFFFNHLGVVEGCAPTPLTQALLITRDGMHFTIELYVLDGDWMAVFGHSNATSLKGKPYNNNYCWRMRFSGVGVVIQYKWRPK